MDDAQLERRALFLIRRHGVAQKDVLGAYSASPLRQTEFLLHEVAHWLTLGGSVDKVPTKLSNRMGAAFKDMPKLSANSLELDTSLVTYLAGFMMGLWSDPGPIARSCTRNLQGLMSLGPTDPTLKEFQLRWSLDSWTYFKMALGLARWYGPRHPLPCRQQVADSPKVLPGLTPAP